MATLQAILQGTNLGIMTTLQGVLQVTMDYGYSKWFYITSQLENATNN